jgi:hypothetical protein
MMMAAKMVGTSGGWATTAVAALALVLALALAWMRTAPATGPDLPPLLRPPRPVDEAAWPSDVDVPTLVASVRRRAAAGTPAFGHAGSCICDTAAAGAGGAAAGGPWLCGARGLASRSSSGG